MIFFCKSMYFWLNYKIFYPQILIIRYSGFKSFVFRYNEQNKRMAYYCTINNKNNFIVILTYFTLFDQNTLLIYNLL